VLPEVPLLFEVQALLHFVSYAHEILQKNFMAKFVCKMGLEFVKALHLGLKPVDTALVI
jgi:hypothetical protein